MAQPQITKGSGPDALPEGAASEVNALPQTMSSEAGAAQVAEGAQQASTGGGQGQAPVSGDEAAMAGVAGQVPQAPPQFQPKSEQDQFLYAQGPGTSPRIQTGGSLTAGPIPPPPGVSDWLPALQMAAADPQAAPQVKALFSLISYHLSQQGS